MADRKDPDRQAEKTRPGFAVNDRRSFAGAAEAPGEAEAPAEAKASGEARAPVTSGSESAPSIDFHTFILSLGSSALLHLGELDSPDGEPSAPDLALAKQTIDIIAMLQEKAKGNLTAPEANLVESLLYDLRLRFVEKSKPPSAG